jgi:hypothetical protein
MEAITFESFKKELINLLVFSPEPEKRQDWENTLHDYYVEFKEDYFRWKVTVEEWANEYLYGYSIKTHSYMLKSEAIAQRDELKKQGYKFQIRQPKN